MHSRQVTELFTRFAAAGIAAWAAGGWAVDALAGHQTREHDDLDLAVDADDLTQILEILTTEGFTVTVDWSPVRLELTAGDGRVVDLHPVAFAADGSGTQAGFDGESFSYSAEGFTVGTIDGAPVPCLARDQQLRFREGYTLRAKDEHDLDLLKKLRS